LATVNYNSGISSIVYKYTTGWAVFQKYITGDLIVAATIVAANIASNTITATQIAANTITADRLNVTQLSAISADMGTLTAGTIRLPGTGTSYIIIDGANNRIDVYDSGTLRVRLGQL
jgi:hypothetical protein